MDYYKLLNISRTASVEEIKKSYRILALKLHPDRHVSSNIAKSEAEEKFKLVNLAYQVLIHEKRRKVYDEHIGVAGDHIREALKRHQHWNPQPSYRKNHTHPRQPRHNYENDIDPTKFNVNTWKQTHYGVNVDQLDAENIRRNLAKQVHKHLHDHPPKSPNKSHPHTGDNHTDAKHDIVGKDKSKIKQTDQVSSCLIS